MHAPPRIICLIPHSPPVCLPRASLLLPLVYTASLLHPRTHRCGVYEKIMNYFFVITRARKNKEGSCVMSRVAVLLRIHPWS